MNSVEKSTLVSSRAVLVLVVAGFGSVPVQAQGTTPSPATTPRIAVLSFDVPFPYYLSTNSSNVTGRIEEALFNKRNDPIRASQDNHRWVCGGMTKEGDLL